MSVTRPTSAPSSLDAEAIGLILVPGFALMSYAALVEPLRAANQLSGRTLYRWWHAAPGDAPVVASNGVAILPDFAMGGSDPGLNALFVCAGGNPATFDDRIVFNWLRRLALSGVTIGGVSGGPYILARAGLLDGRRATIHWEHAPSFQEAFPRIEVTRSLFEIDGDRITCAGGISALDMMVARIARGHGLELATAVGEWFMHTHVREGVGPQRMDLRFRLGIADEKLLSVLRAMEAHIEMPLTRAALASLASISLRQLERSFRRHLGRSLHQHYLGLRLARARQFLRETSLPVVDVALASGFASASQFARAFGRAYGYAPNQARAMIQTGRRASQTRLR